MLCRHEFEAAPAGAVGISACLCTKPSAPVAAVAPRADSPLSPAPRTGFVRWLGPDPQALLEPGCLTLRHSLLGGLAQPCDWQLSVPEVMPVFAPARTELLALLGPTTFRFRRVRMLQPQRQLLCCCARADLPPCPVKKVNRLAPKGAINRKRFPHGATLCLDVASPGALVVPALTTLVESHQRRRCHSRAANDLSRPVASQYPRCRTGCGAGSCGLGATRRALVPVRTRPSSLSTLLIRLRNPPTRPDEAPVLPRL